MINNELVSLLERVLGHGQHSGSEVKFYCPICRHHKPKLEICVDDEMEDYQKWNCWVCGKTHLTRGKSIVSLFIKLNVAESFIEKAKLFPVKHKKVALSDDEKKQQIITTSITLPDEFKPLYIKPEGKYNYEYKNALHYLKTRNIGIEEIIKYNIGYCDSGKFDGRLIIPSYDCNNQLNYFVARSYYESEGNAYLNPDISRDVVGFENTINWNYPITLVEGVFDAIAAKRNAIPLFGKDILPQLKIKIAKNNVTDIYIALDDDAILDMIPLLTYFKGEGINTYLVILPQKDPSKLGYKKFITHLLDAEQPSQHIIFKLKQMRTEQIMKNKL
jgi:transcription elongation factor Elf1